MPGPSTTAVHGRHQASSPAPAAPGSGADAGALGIPIHLSSTFRYPELEDGAPSPYIYSRYANPTVDAVEAHLGALEGAPRALLFASGLAAASTAVQALVPPGRGIAVQQGVYGGTTAMLADEWAPRGVVLHSLGPVEPPARLPAGTALVWMESITNPLLRVADVAAWADAAHDAGAALLVDSTFATPILQRPLAMGADVVLHSATKYLGGHSDLLAGALACRDSALADAAWTHRRNLGGSLDPMPAWLLWRGLRTLALRMQRQCSNAAALAGALDGRRGVQAVHHPGLNHHPDHAVAGRVLGAAGGIVTLDLGTLAAAKAFRRAVRLVRPAASLGGVESLVSLPCETSHAYAAPTARRRDGIADGLVRISCGIEDPEDLLADVEQAVEAASALAPAQST